MVYGRLVHISDRLPMSKFHEISVLFMYPFRYGIYLLAACSGTVLALLKKAGNLRRGNVENRQAFVLEQSQLSLPNR